MLKKHLIIFSNLLIVIILAACSETNSLDHSKAKMETTIQNGATPVPSLILPTPLPQPKGETELKQALAFIPSRLHIPSVQLDAPVVPVGILENGQMDVPQSSDIVGILSPGPLPGEIGTAIMAGHVDSQTGPAIFYPLKKIKTGDPVLISNEEGQSLVFKVISVESYITSEAPLDKIFGDTDQSRLNLITCTGKYNRKLGTHEKRLVVFTRLMDDH